VRFAREDAPYPGGVVDTLSHGTGWALDPLRHPSWNVKSSVIVAALAFEVTNKATRGRCVLYAPVERGGAGDAWALCRYRTPVTRTPHPPPSS